MSVFKDLSNKRFGRLVAITGKDRNKQSKAIWTCVCDCGNSVKVLGTSLSRGDTTSCGCFQKEQTKAANLGKIRGRDVERYDRIGERIGRLLIVEYAGSVERKDGKGPIGRWKCVCDCGKETIIRAGQGTNTKKLWLPR